MGKKNTMCLVSIVLVAQTGVDYGRYGVFPL